MKIVACRKETSAGLGQSLRGYMMQKLNVYNLALGCFWECLIPPTFSFFQTFNCDI